jgi:hypothetical protein
MYAAEFPNRFLAALAPVALAHKEHPYVQGLLTKGFEEWNRFHLGSYPEKNTFPIHFVGSIAMELKKFLSMSLKKEGLKVGRFDNKPIDALLEFHTQTR